MGFPIWFVAHDLGGLSLVVLLIFVPLHSFATHFSGSSRFFNPSGQAIGGLPAAYDRPPRWDMNVGCYCEADVGPLNISVPLPATVFLENPFCSRYAVRKPF